MTGMEMVFPAVRRNPVAAVTIVVVALLLVVATLFYVSWYASLPEMVTEGGRCKYIIEHREGGRDLLHDCGWEEGRKYTIR